MNLQYFRILCGQGEQGGYVGADDSTSDLFNQISDVQNSEPTETMPDTSDLISQIANVQNSTGFPDFSMPELDISSPSGVATLAQALKAIEETGVQTITNNAPTGTRPTAATATKPEVVVTKGNYILPAILGIAITGIIWTTLRK